MFGFSETTSLLPSEDTNTSLSETIKVGAFADNKRPVAPAVDPGLVFPDAPFSSLLLPKQQSPPQVNYRYEILKIVLLC